MHHPDPTSIERIEARAYCEAHGVPCLLEPEDSERDRRAVAAMERLPTAAGVACYLAGVRWMRVAHDGAKPYWEVCGFDRRSKPSTPPPFGVWLDGTPNTTFDRTPAPLIDALQRERIAAVEAFEASRREPDRGLSRAQALAIYERQVNLAPRTSPNIQVLVAVDAIIEGARVVVAPYVQALEAVWPLLSAGVGDRSAPPWLGVACDRVAQGMSPTDAMLRSMAEHPVRSDGAIESGAASDEGRAT